MKISDVLWKAANECLREPGSSTGKWAYSCYAVLDAEHGGTHWLRNETNAVRKSRVLTGLKRMGCPIDSPAAFDEFDTESEQQCARYAWLMFAHDIALEQGL